MPPKMTSEPNKEEQAPIQGSNSVTPSEDDARWDPAKAETVGIATYLAAEDEEYRSRFEGRGDFSGNPFKSTTIRNAMDLEKNPDSEYYLGILDNYLSHYQFSRNNPPHFKYEYEWPDEQHLLSDITGIKDSLYIAEKKLKTEDNSQNREAVEQLQAKLQPLLEQVKPYVRKWSKSHLEEMRSNQDAKIEKVEQLLETLYNLNPDAFSQVSTLEFIAATKEFHDISREIEEIETKLPRMQALATTLQDRLKNKWVTDGGWIKERLLGNLRRDDFITREEGESLMEKFKLISKDFDSTRRQELEKYIEIVDEYLNKVTIAAEEARKKQQAFSEKFHLPDLASGATSK